MKVVLFCGGLGTRIRDYDDTVPKPMIEVGQRPILWHIMKYYAHFGHNEFILCLGYKSEVIKNYFLSYDECVSNDFVLSHGGREVQLLSSDIDEWKITFVDTGQTSSIGERLKAVESHLDGEEIFLANYSDGLSDLHLPRYIDFFENSGSVASFLAVHSPQSFHVADLTDTGLVKAISPLSDSNLWINGGFFAFRKEIFDYLHAGEDLVNEPFGRLIANGELKAYRYDGFWRAMDTFKDRQALESLIEEGDGPWEVWKTSDHPDNG